jgi:aspartyl-tRNA(Asn)/glutamyl-tRNA(Gln) amidotransferase subunit A
VAAIKPTFGTVPIDAVVPLAYHLDHAGPMARRVEDLAPLLRAVSDLPDFGDAEPRLPPRLGLVEEYFLEQADSSVRRVVESALERLRCGGAAIMAVRLPESFATVRAMHYRINAVEAALYHRRQFAEHGDAYGPKLRQLLKEGLGTQAVEYAEALAAQRQFRTEIVATLAHVDALIMPATPTTAPARLDTTGDSEFQAPWSFAGVPAVTLPCGLADDGMPVGLQLAGRHGEDFGLLRTARWCEGQVGFEAVPPLMTVAS